MNLASGPLWRAQLLKFGPEEHTFLVTLHHIITDAWSMTLFWEELSDYYASAVPGRLSTRQPPSIQYVDFALWQRKLIQGEMLQRQMDYWEDQLLNLTPLAFPTNTPRPVQQTYRGASQWFMLSTALVQ